MFARTLESRRTERALRELLRAVDAARIGVAWSGQLEQERLESDIDFTSRRSLAEMKAS